VWLLPCVIAVAGAAFVLYRLHSKGAAVVRPAPPIRTVAVRAGALERTVRLAGTTAAENSVELRAPYLRGRRGRGDFRILIEDLAGAGRRVSQGDVVASFDRMYMQIYADNERAQRVNREASLTKARAAHDLRMLTHQQKLRTAQAAMEKAALDMKTTPVRSAIQAGKLRLAFEEAEAAYRALLNEVPQVEISVSADVERARLEVEEARIEERRAQANVERMEVRAPIGGLVVASEVFHAGEMKRIQKGDQLRRGQPYMRIVDPDSMIVEARANQVDVESLRLGSPVRVHFDAYPGLTLPGRLRSIGPLAKSAGRRQDFVAEVPVVVKLEGKDPRVIPSLSVGADVVLDREESDGIVPREAVFYDAEDRQPYAFVKTSGGWERRDLELGLSNHIAVAVRSGLSEGELVAAERPTDAF
jgi:multidrug efflux pump subunit AcrA (membrane-fusion protein)